MNHYVELETYAIEGKPMNAWKSMSHGAMIALGQKIMRKSSDSFLTAIGAALVYGTYKDQRKLLNTFKRKLEENGFGS